jgi:phage gp46-like protein
VDLVLYHGDHRRDERGYPQRAEGAAEKIQQAMIRLTVPKGRFELDPELGSRLYELGRASREPGRIEELALEYAQEALLELTQMKVLSATAQNQEEGLLLELELCWEGEAEAAERFRLELDLNG